MRSFLWVKAAESEAGESAVDNKVGAGGEAAGIACQVYADRFKLFRFSEPSHGSHGIPLLNQRNEGLGSENQVGSDISRVFYFFVIGKRIVLTNGFIKKTQKTPKSEIELAKKYRNEFLNREDK